MNNVKRYVGMWWLIVMIVAVDAYSQESAVFPTFDPQRNAEKDIENAIAQATKERKRVLIDVGGEWCVWCRRLDSLFINTPELLNYLQQHYVVVKINVSKENRNERVLSRFPKIEGVPHLFVLESNGTLLHSQETGELELPPTFRRKGYDRAKMWEFLKQWSLPQKTQ